MGSLFFFMFVNALSLFTNGFVYSMVDFLLYRMIMLRFQSYGVICTKYRVHRWTPGDYLPTLKLSVWLWLLPLTHLGSGGNELRRC